MFGFDWLGRQFGIDPRREEVAMLEPGTGEVLESLRQGKWTVYSFIVDSDDYIRRSTIELLDRIETDRDLLVSVVGSRGPEEKDPRILALMEQVIIGSRDVESE